MDTINKKNKIVIYTVIMGDYDDLIEPEFVSADCDYVCFSDMSQASGVWKTIVISPIFPNDLARSSREPKILSHKFLSDYEYSIYVDSNMKIIGDPLELIEKYLSTSNMAVFSHANVKFSAGHSKLQKVFNFFTFNIYNKERIKCVYVGAEYTKQLSKFGKQKDCHEIIDRQMNEYKKNGYPSQNGMLNGAVLVRRHNKKDVIKTMKSWWVQVNLFSHRDQMSFNYVAWKNNFKFNYIKGDFRNNKFVRWQKHKKKVSNNVCA